MTMHLFLYEPSYRRLESRIRQIAPDARVSVMATSGSVTTDGRTVSVDELTAQIAWANLDVFAWEGRRDYFRALLKSETLEWIQSAAAGVDDPVFARLVAKGITLTSSDAQAPAIADFVLASVLDFYQGAAERRRLQTQATWVRTSFRELADTRWLIIGYGHIGRETARRVNAFGASVAGIRRTPKTDQFAAEVTTMDRLYELLPRADVIVLSCGLNEETRGLVDEDFLSHVKHGSVLVNVGRGGLVDEVALLAALNDEVIAHAVLDVFVEEPLPATNPFWSHPNVTISAHGAAQGSGNARRGDELFLDNLMRYSTGRELRNVVKAADLT
jgi:phosphoglycerate dehydrogenase-like enzyme